MEFLMPFLLAHPSIRALFARISLCAVLVALCGVPRSDAQTKPLDSTPASVPVVVSDFEMHSVPVRPKPPAGTPPAPEKAKPEVPLVYGDTDVPSAQARQLMDYFATTLVQTLDKKGFQAARASGANPATGALIRGVFAEPDPMNRIRRALLGGGAPNTRFLLYVGIFNLARQEQPLYQPATNQSSESGDEPIFALNNCVSAAKSRVSKNFTEEDAEKICAQLYLASFHQARQGQAPNQPTPGQAPDTAYGPVITLNNYVPMAKYEVDKNPTEEEVQKICNQIAASLLALLEKNEHAFEH
jgi:Domain of unknown function (DUF4410)